MTYTEIENHRYENCKDATERMTFMASLPVEERRAHGVLDELLARKGFDDWFERCEEEIQDEIFEAIKIKVI